MIKLKLNEWHTNIKATEFKDEKVAYNDLVNAKYGVAIPFNSWLFEKPYESVKNKIVAIHNPEEDLFHFGVVIDSGPFIVDDIGYIFENKRPLTEKFYKTKNLPKYHNLDKLKKDFKNRKGSAWENKPACNGAGIDLKPSLMKKLTNNYIPNQTSIYVDWCFVDESELHDKLLKSIRTGI